MTVTIGQKEFEQASNFSDIKGCPLGVKLKELFKDKSFIVMTTRVVCREDYKIYNFKGWSEKEWLNRDAETFTFGQEVNDYITAAKRGEEVPTFEVEIIGLELN